MNHPQPPATVSVVVPTYARPQQLRQCLEGLLAQERPADQVVVVHRPDDGASAGVVRALPEGAITVALVHEAGVLAAMRTGVQAATGDVIAFTDDDAVPRPTWVGSLLEHYRDPRVGGVGGRDEVHPHDGAGESDTVSVGRVTRWGKLLGNHNHGVGPAVRVDVLKGVNMSFRREALALPRTMRGAGAQVHFEIAVCAWARRHGWELVYDPAVLVDHYPGPRFDNDQRHRPDAAATANEAANLVGAVLEVDPRLLPRRAAFGLLVGDRATPGVVRAAAALARGDRTTAAKLVPSLRGQVRGLYDAARGRRIEMVPASAEPSSAP